MPSTGASGCIDEAAARAWPERLTDVALGLSALGWAGAGAWRWAGAGAWRWPTVAPALAIAVVNAVVGVLFLTRRSARRRAPLPHAAACLGSVVASAVALRLAPPLEAWPVAASVLLTAGAAGAVVGLVALGSRFAVLPSVRGLVTRGPFGLVRHPIYACELCMVAGCAVAAGPARGLGALVLAFALAVVRIRIEERLFAGEAGYGDYRRRVAWRLVPGVW